MVDRTDIDALLVGALYGELSAAEEARLTQHLESHPADKVVLEDLTRARSAVRESRILAFQAEPPQAVSAILLQEAHRRAPKPVRAPEEREGWFARFVRSFAAHPAMAAAAMLVLVVGVTSTVFIAKGTDNMSAKQASVSTADERRRDLDFEKAPEPQAPTAAPTTASAGSGAPADSYRAKLDDNITGQGFKGGETESRAQLDLQQRADGAKNDQAAVNRKVAKPTAPSGITVLRPDPQPKELSIASDQAPVSGEGQGTLGGDEGGRPGQMNGSPPSAHLAAKDTPTPTNANTTPAQAVDAPKAPAEDKSRDASESSLVAWATERKKELVARVKAGRCDAAADIAVQIANRAPDFYHSDVERDIDVKKCLSYFRDAQQRDAEQTQKARAAKQKINNEPAANDLKSR